MHYTLKEASAGYFWSCIFVFFIAHWNMWNNINHWHKNTQLELFLTLLSCNYNTTISIKTNRSKTWTLPMMSPALTSWKIDYAETTKLGGWLVFSLGFLMFRLVDSWIHKWAMLISRSIHLDCKPTVKCDDMVPTQTITIYWTYISEKYNTILWVTIYERSSQACIFMMMMQVIPLILELMGKGNTE